MRTTVHVVFKTHLDLGYTDFAAAVRRQYLEAYVPRALRLARLLREGGGRDRFTWTTGSWIIYEYLEQGDRRSRGEAEQGILAGDLRWHALPFTTHCELMDPELFRFGLGLSRQLDRRFGVRTIAAKMTDIPGHTRGIVPLLAAAGVRFLHIGVNAASRPPSVPDLFRWQEPETGAELTVMYAKASYGGIGTVAGLRHVLAIEHTGDNLGPQTEEQIHTAFAGLRARFSGDTVRASTLDAFASALGGVRDRLPLVTEEIGDTWIHGTASDPWKVSAFRALQRLRTGWLAAGRARPDDPRLQRFSRELLCVAEHTWGMDSKVHLADYRNYRRGDFERARRDDAAAGEIPAGLASAEPYRRLGAPQSFRKIEASWQEQRAYLLRAVDHLGRTSLGRQAARSLRECTPTRATGGRSIPAGDAGQPRDFADMRVRFSAAIGCITSLVDRRTGVRWAGPRSPLAVFRYQSLSCADYERFLHQYVVNLDDPQTASWALPDYGRPGLRPSDSRSAFHRPRVVAVRRSADGLRFELELAERARRTCGAPAAVQLSYRFLNTEPAIEIELCWFRKPANRMPEAAWLSFSPPVSDPSSWEVHKLGRWISPLEVASCGNRNMHGVGVGARVSSGVSRLVIESLDAHLVAPGAPRLLEFDDSLPDLSGGVHFCLHANLSSTNFPLWYEDDARFRFRLRLELR